MDKKFDVKKINKLNNPERLKFQSPETIWSAAGVVDPEVVVDIGAGTGFFAVPFSDKMAKGKLYACDIAEEMIDWMSTRIDPSYKGKIIPKKMGENSIDLESGVADLVYMINLHHELDNVGKMLEEVKRILKPGGKLMIVDWKKKETPHGPPVEIRFDEKEVERQLTESRFLDITHHPLLDYHFIIVAKKAD